MLGFGDIRDKAIEKGGWLFGRFFGRLLGRLLGLLLGGVLGRHWRLNAFVSRIA